MGSYGSCGESSIDHATSVSKPQLQTISINKRFTKTDYTATYCINSVKRRRPIVITTTGRFISNNMLILTLNY